RAPDYSRLACRLFIHGRLRGPLYCRLRAFDAFGYSARSSSALSRFLGSGPSSVSWRRRADVAERRTTALDGHIAQRDYARWPSLFVKHRQPAHRVCPHHLNGLLDAVAEGKGQRLSAADLSYGG